MRIVIICKGENRSQQPATAGVRLPMSAPCFSRLSEGEQFLVWSMRHWMVALVRRQSVPDSVLRVLDAIGRRDLFCTITLLVLLISRDADRPLQVFPPCCSELSLDEQRIASAFDCARAGALVNASGHLTRLMGRQPRRALLERVAEVAQLASGRFAASINPGVRA